MRKMLITGGSGFLGRHLAQQFRSEYEIYIASRNEQQLKFVSSQLGVDFYPLDVCNSASVNECFQRIRPTVVVHAAATKYVDYAEKFPNECIDINVVGSQNIARASSYFGVDSVVGISTDKVTSPISNIYGLSKAVMERSFVLQDTNSKTRFMCVRYGNVVWSTGSIFPIWEKMSQAGQNIVSTGSQMYRFFFSIVDAVKLVEVAIAKIDNLHGKILSIPMKAANIGRVLDVWSEVYGSTWSKGESRFGDRHFENLIGENELKNTDKIEIDKTTYFVVDPRSAHELNLLTEPYSSTSATQLDKLEILNLIQTKPNF